MTRSVADRVRLSRWLFAIACCATTLVVAGAIALGPGDLYEKDQPKTIAYTADVVLHHRFALPRDVIYQPATKPPMYNWMDALVVVVARSWSETALKAPSILSAIGVGVLLLRCCRTGIPACLLVGTPAESDREIGRNTCPTGLLAVAMFAAFGVDVRHGSTMRLAYLARPDMLQAFFVTLAWFAATRACLGVTNEDVSSVPERPLRPLARISVLIRGAHSAAAIFWLGVIAAVLTKGPLALLLLIYAPLAARGIGGRWSLVRRLHPIVGTGATIACVGAWLACADRVDPAHVRGVMLGAEIVDRVATATPEGLAKPFYFAAMWFVTKGGPIAWLAVIGAIAAWRTSDRTLRAASLWLIVLLVGLSIPAGKRIDYLLPTYAPASLLAAWIAIEACRRVRVPIVVATLVPLALAIQLAHARLTKFGEARERWTDRTVAFCRDVRAKIGDDALVVIVRGKHPIPTLLGRHQGSLLTPDDLRRARWAILPTDATMATPTLASAPVPSGFEVIESRPLRSLGLYDLRAPDAPSEDTLADEQRKCGEWTSTDNPYRAPGTVWRGD